MNRLDCTIMPYAWGSRTAIAELTGRPPSDKPEGELWMGAHPVAPSRVVREETTTPLDRVIADSPAATLGPRVVGALGPRLPFLLKVLAAAEPLSLQAHPTMDRARAGWDDEERRNVPRDAPTRNYKDASHKPELLCALSPFTALSGFRVIATTLRLFDALDVAELEPVLGPLRRSPDAEGLAETFRALMTHPAPAPLVTATLDACARATAFPRERALARRLAELYPGDVGIVSALFLELLELAPGDAIYLGAGNLHAYVEGTGVEIMASSDNVLRGGLTKKHVDVPELLDVLDFSAGPASIVRPKAVDAHEAVYETPAREFRLSRLEIDGDVTRTVDGPEILLTTAGHVASESLALPRGASAFVPASEAQYTLRGSGVVYRARTNLQDVERPRPSPRAPLRSRS